LLDFVNQKYKLVRKLYGMTSPQGLPLNDVKQISDKLWENKMVDEDAAIVSSWKRAIQGKFIVDRHLRNGSVLISYTL